MRVFWPILLVGLAACGFNPHPQKRGAPLRPWLSLWLPLRDRRNMLEERIWPFCIDVQPGLHFGFHLLQWVERELRRYRAAHGRRV